MKKLRSPGPQSAPFSGHHGLICKDIPKQRSYVLLIFGVKRDIKERRPETINTHRKKMSNAQGLLLL
jgi:hypothetical protein